MSRWYKSHNHTHKMHVTSALVDVSRKLTPRNCDFALKIPIEDSLRGGGEPVWKGWGQSSVLGLWREGLSSSHRSALSCFWTPVIQFLAFLLKQFSLSASPCHQKSPRRRLRSEIMGVSFFPHTSLQPPAQMTTLGRRVDWKHSGIIKAQLLSASLSQMSM